MNKAEEYAEFYSSLGWMLVPLEPKKKYTMRKGWQLKKNLESDGTFWKKHPDWNMGVHLGHSSICTLDIDNIEYTQIMFNELGIDYEDILSIAPRTIGQPNRDKAFFSMPDGMSLKTHKIFWTDRETKEPVPVIEFRAGDVQDVLPPSIHPKTQKPYEWRRPPSEVLPEIPKQILTIWKDWDSYKHQLMEMCPWDTSRHIQQQKLHTTRIDESDSPIKQFSARFRVEEMLQKHGYKKVTPTRYLSPFSTSGIPGVIVFPSENRFYTHHASDPFDCDHSHDSFDIYCELECAGDTVMASHKAAEMLGMSVHPKANTEMEEHGREIAEKFSTRSTIKDKLSDIPDNLLYIPGILQDVVDYYNATAYRNQPQFAVQTALAVGSVVMGRRFVTDSQNYSSLYLINIGVSSCGKEHVKTVIERVLTESGVENLIGPAGYKSGMGVFSALVEKPCHVAIIDEIGRYLNAARNERMSHLTEAQTQMMEVFGRASGYHVLPGFSKIGMTGSQKKAMSEYKYINRPAITIVGMTVPGKFYESLSSGDVIDGNIPRYLIVESVLGRQLGCVKQSAKIPERLIRWIKQCANTHDGDGNLTNLDSPDNPPEPLLVPISHAANRRFIDFQKFLLKEMDALDEYGIAELYGRSEEIARRIALIIAVSCNSETVSEDHAEWAIEYVKFYAAQTVDMVKSRVANSDFEALCKDVHRHIRKSGSRGLTKRELSRQSTLYRKVEPRMRNSVLEALQDDSCIEFRDIKTGGRKRCAFVSVD